jgi:hypothetical protein
MRRSLRQGSWPHASSFLGVLGAKATSAGVDWVVSRQPDAPCQCSW